MARNGSGKARDACRSRWWRRGGGFIPPQRTGALVCARREGGGTWGNHGFPHVEPVDAPEAPSFPVPDPSADGERGYEPIKPRSGLFDLARKLVAPLIALGFLIVKFGGFVLKFKVLTTGLSMLVSVAAYAWIWGLPFAIGFVLLIFVHELGHVLELRRQGVPASAPLFIPFLGAVIGMKELPDDAWKEAKVALAGPILGSVGAAACWIAAEATGSEMLMGLAFVGFFLNLFNLIPIVPLDGGRAAGALHPALWFVGLLMMVGLVVLNPNPLLLIIVLLGGLDLWRRWRERGEAGDYYRLSLAQRATVGVVYLGLVAVLALAMSATYVERDL